MPPLTCTSVYVLSRPLVSIAECALECNVIQQTDSRDYKEDKNNVF